MTYIDLLNKFWNTSRYNPCSCNETAMYLYLLHRCNILHWGNPFELNTRDLELTLGVSRTTIAGIREKLKQRGLIDFAKGLGRGKAIYKLNEIKVTDSVLNEKVCVQSEDTKLDTKLDTTDICVQSEDTKLDTTLDTNENFTLLDKDIKTNKDNNNNDVVDDACEDKKFLDDFFAEGIPIESFCMSNHIAVADMRRLAEEVMVEWRLTGQRHDSITDARRHLVNHIRRKIEKSRQDGSTKPTGSSYEQRQAEFARHIAAKLAADDAEPDINGYY